ncbi:MAG: hypothetical protein HYX35_05830 [Proteobacteria bacterium]|nr:hypothetical protein [Pseudomonadota bacterium]
MTRTILLSSFALALMSAQGAFTSVAAEEVASKDVAAPKAIVLKTETIDKAAVVGSHPEAAPQADRTVEDCNENYPC